MALVVRNLMAEALARLHHEIGGSEVLAHIRALTADRDRLARRVEELESALRAARRKRRAR